MIGHAYYLCHKRYFTIVFKRENQIQEFLIYLRTTNINILQFACLTNYLTCNQRPATRDRRPATCNPRPATRDLRPATRDLQAATRDLQPATCKLDPPFWNSIFLTVQRFSLLLDLLKHFKDYHKSHSRLYGHIWLLLLVLKSSYLLLNRW